MPLFQKSIACWGVGTTCPNRKERIGPIAGENDDVIVRLDVNRGSSLEECFENYMKDANPGFSRCQSQTCTKKKFGSRIWYKLREAPDVLFIHISRFTPANRKSTKKITIPEILDLDVYLETEDRNAGETAQYRLDGIVSHAGNVNTGHYITHVRDVTNSTAWYRIDDTTVTRSFFANAVNDPKKYKSWAWTPVILAYTKAGASTRKQGGFSTESSEAGPSTAGSSTPKKTIKKTSNSDPASSIRTGIKSPTLPPTPANATLTVQLLPSEGSQSVDTITQSLHYAAGPNGNIPIRVELELPDGRTFRTETVLEDTKDKRVVRKHHLPKQLSPRVYQITKSPKQLSPKQSHKRSPSPETSLSSNVPSSNGSFVGDWMNQLPKNPSSASAKKSSSSKKATSPPVLASKKRKSSEEDEMDVKEEVRRLRSWSR